MKILYHLFRQTQQKISRIKSRLKERENIVWNIGIPLVSCLFLFFLLYKDIWAQAADNVLRPLIGEKNTLSLEAVYFNIQDKMNAEYYALFGAKTLSAVTNSSNQVKLNNTDKMSLSDISPAKELPSLPGEGIWTPITTLLFPDQTVMAKTFIRPDVTHPYAIAYIVKMDMHKLGIAAVAGTYYPGGAHKAYGPGMVPKSVQDAGTLIAAFNGGFQEKDGGYGMIVDDKTFVPLKLNLPTLVLHQDGSANFTQFLGQNLASGAAALRQNGPFLVENGKVTSYVEQGNDTWGRTITNSMYTWRSGLGITAQGNIVYVAGNSLIPQTLAKALLDAGVINAIQLDINPPWVRFMSYQSMGNGQYTSLPLAPSMDGSKIYLKKYNKDFFYIYKK